MTRAKRSRLAGFGGLAACALAACVAACQAPASPEPPRALSGIGIGSGAGSAGCTDCTCKEDCDEETAWQCPSGACNAAGTCACDPATASTDCPDTGCCEAVIDVDGQPMVDGGGAPVYQCASPGCTSDGDCDSGEVCLAGATCGQTACGCPDGYGPDPEQPCCLAVDTMGVCCTSGEVDDAGNCACSDPLMTDDGHGCQCPDGMVTDDDGACVCADPSAAFDPDLGTCLCVDGYHVDTDPYSGVATCAPDGEEPDPCPDPHAEIDPDTGECACQPGFVLGDTLEMTTAQCVPVTCGDGVCGPGETCELCSYDCGSCGEGGPDAGVPDAPHEAGRDAPPPDAGVPDAVVTPFDAGVPHLDAFCHTGSGTAGAVRCTDGS
ncbi:MAG: hypothetical protein E6J90_09510 [Deltaproteobacteria bacterium]|nr:MAG: hypothetical protein E6J90_09510 [Deltaproteobacteria bacterium]